MKNVITSYSIHYTKLYDGVQPYTFSWTKTSNSSPDYITNANSATAEDLWVDVFTLLVTDRDGCTDTETVILDDIGTITFDTEKISDPTCGENGSARVYNFDDGSGSFVPTSILWSSTETNDTSIQLAVGINTVIVSSASCQKADTITLVGDILRVDNIYSYADFTSTTDPGGNGYAVANIDGGVITSYSIHYTKLYDHLISAICSTFHINLLHFLFVGNLLQF